jgi:hypothetical protein
MMVFMFGGVRPFCEHSGGEVETEPCGGSHTEHRHRPGVMHLSVRRIKDAQAPACVHGGYSWGRVGDRKRTPIPFRPRGRLNTLHRST